LATAQGITYVLQVTRVCSFRRAPRALYRFFTDSLRNEVRTAKLKLKRREADLGKFFFQLRS